MGAIPWREEAIVSEFRTRLTARPASSARCSRISSPATDLSTAVTFCRRAASKSVCLPAPHARSSAGPIGSNGSNSLTKLAGSAKALCAAARCRASQSDGALDDTLDGLLADMKKAPEQQPRSLRTLAFSRRQIATAEPDLNAERTTTAAGALHVGIVELESRTFHGLNVIDLHTFKIHGAHLVHGNLQPVEIQQLVGIVGLILKSHVVLETGTAAADNGHAQSNRHGALHLHDFLDLGARYGRHIDNIPSRPRLQQGLFASTV